MKRARNIHFDDEVYEAIERLALQVSVQEGKRVSVAELIRRAVEEKYRGFLQPQLKIADRKEEYGTGPN